MKEYGDFGAGLQVHRVVRGDLKRDVDERRAGNQHDALANLHGFPAPLLGVGEDSDTGAWRGELQSAEYFGQMRHLGGFFVHPGVQHLQFQTTGIIGECLVSRALQFGARDIERFLRQIELIAGRGIVEDKSVRRSSRQAGGSMLCQLRLQSTPAPR